MLFQYHGRCCCLKRLHQSCLSSFFLFLTAVGQTTHTTEAHDHDGGGADDDDDDIPLILSQLIES